MDGGCDWGAESSDQVRIQRDLMQSLYAARVRKQRLSVRQIHCTPRGDAPGTLKTPGPQMPSQNFPGVTRMDWQRHPKNPHHDSHLACYSQATCQPSHARGNKIQASRDQRACQRGVGVGGRWCKSIRFLCNMSIPITFANACTTFLGQLTSAIYFTEIITEVQDGVWTRLFKVQAKDGRT